MEHANDDPGTNAIRLPAGSTARALYDWDELVQEDRVHRLIYTDPAIFAAEMTHIFGGTWVYLAHESEIPQRQRLHHRAGSACARSSSCATANGKIRALYNRCTHRGTTLCRWEKGNAKSFQCPYHGWNFLNTGKLRGVPWPDGYACDFRDPKYNVAQVPRVESYRGFIFGTLNLDAPPLVEHGSGRSPSRSTNGSTAIPAARSSCARPIGSSTRATGSSPTTIPATAITSSIRTARCSRPRTAWPTRRNKGMAYYRNSPDAAPMYMRYMGNGHHFKDKRPNLNQRPGGLWAIESPHPGMEHYEAEFRRRYGDARRRPARSRRLRAGQHQRVPQPVAARQPHPGVRADQRRVRPTRSGTAPRIVDESGELGDAVDEINALRMRTQEGFPNFGEVDDVANFEQIQRGLQCLEDEWVYMHRGLGIPGRVKHAWTTAPSRRPPPTRCSCASTSRNGSG